MNHEVSMRGLHLEEDELFLKKIGSNLLTEMCL